MTGAYEFAPVIALLPLLAFVIALVFGSRMPQRGAFAGIVSTGGSLVVSLWVALTLWQTGEPYHAELFEWIAVEGHFTFHFGILIDPLSALMLVIVSLVAFLVNLFSLGYMNAQGETGLPRYYAELGLFSFSMLAFVMADNLVMAFIFFELVGLCSYLLIGFWFRERAPASAQKKAFLVTRFGDYFFLVGTIAIAVTFGSTMFVSEAGLEGFPQLAQDAITAGETFFGLSATTWVTLTGLLVLGGVIGKSAQFPLHTWLPDAMEGPTTVSALIHAATMVAAGVYLVARMFGYFALSPTTLAIIAFIGGFTALFAATMGVVNDDIKTVLAYSTISQYGYMMLALGVGGYVAAVFHLMNHAFFKALLFLGAGAVIVAVHHERDMWAMGGLKAHLPVTYWMFLIGALALAGIVPFSGFWSKDEVLFDALIVGLNHPVILVAWAMALLAVFLTGLYTFRMVALTFHGRARSEAAEQPHAVGWSIKIPLIVLGVLSAVAGFINMKPVAVATGTDIEYLAQWLNGGFDETAYSTYAGLVQTVAGFEAVDLAPFAPALLALVLAVAGAGLGWKLYAVPDPSEPTTRLGSARDLAVANYYQDELQVWLADGVTRRTARASDSFDQVVIDGTVNGISTVSLGISDRVRRVQTGLVTEYAALIAMGVLVLLVAFGLYGGWF